MAPIPVNSQATTETGPAVSAMAAGSRKIPDPIMFPTTSAVAIQRPIERLSLGFAASPLVDAGETLMSFSLLVQRRLCGEQTEFLVLASIVDSWEPRAIGADADQGCGFLRRQVRATTHSSDTA